MNRAMNLPVTILYGSLSALITILLALNVSLHRMQHKVSAGDPIPDRMFRKVRAHGNSVEWLAVTVLLLAFLELQGAPSLQLHIFGGVMVVARILHSIFMLGRLKLTMLSATTTYVLTAWMAVQSLVMRLR
jgi:uncharacterized membrane protein YecN with MAPEG domain